jgi:hypothetical protein
MRTALYAFVLALSVSGAAFAQNGWTEYQSTQDGFKVQFPEQPAVTNIPWTSEHGFALPARVYAVDRGREHYSVTVVDYTSMERQGTERAKTCPPGAETCLGSDLAGIGYWKHDVRGAILYATARLLKRDVKMTELTWGQQDLVEGHQLQAISNGDRSRTFAFIAMHEMKLYILEGSVPEGYPPPLLFASSLGWVDRNGKGMRYRSIYNNEFHVLEKYPVPALTGQ